MTRKLYRSNTANTDAAAATAGAAAGLPVPAAGWIAGNFAPQILFLRKQDI